MTGMAAAPDVEQDPDAVEWIDNHCHLDPHDDIEAVIAEARAAGVTRLISVGTDVASSNAALDLAQQLPLLWATAGVHPHDAKGGTEGLVDLLERSREPGTKLVAVGECGLDYHYVHSPRALQRDCFAGQIRLAHEYDLPLVIHTREAWEDTFAILDHESTPRRTVFHCFTGGPAEAEACLERGALLSISGIVTFPSADDVRAAVAITPPDRLLVETDSPYLSPVPFRGRRNTPARVAVVGAAVAEVWGLPVAEVARSTSANAIAFYGLDRAGPG